ncbi:class I SAM-dependent methyltransferase [Micromonospora sp. RHAY321]|nr:class I SAM-dependent methyltransferase [Micromonospora sp. RHAY321]
MTDDYQESGEFLHILSGPAWQALRAPVTAALRGAVWSEAQAVDIGAGTGLGTMVLAAALPGADVLAVEPSSVLRAVLLARIVDDADLRARVTVVAADALSVELPDRLSAVLAMNMIGHLTPSERREFLRRVAARLLPGAPLVLNLQPPAEAIPISEVTFGSVKVGRYVYEGSGGAEPAGPDAVSWRMRYRVLGANGSAVRESAVDYRWNVVAAADLLAELADVGLAGDVGQADVIRAVRLA